MKTFFYGKYTKLRIGFFIPFFCVGVHGALGGCCSALLYAIVDLLVFMLWFGTWKRMSLFVLTILTIGLMYEIEKIKAHLSLQLIAYFISWLFLFLGTLPTLYILHKKRLHIQKGFLFRTINYNRIKKIYAKKTFLDIDSFPRNRVRIEYKKLFFSFRKQPYVDAFPNDAEAFIKALESKIKI